MVIENFSSVLFLRSFTEEVLVTINRLNNLVVSKVPGHNFHEIKKELPEEHHDSLRLIVPFPLAVNLGKLSNPFSDSSVISLRVLGPGKMITGKFLDGSSKSLNISLGNDEITEVINSFSKASKRDINDKVFNASYDGVSINAVISEIVGSRFIISKE